jgi:16S rRNA (uracil1498-N3)-methyltransferase
VTAAWAASAGAAAHAFAAALADAVELDGAAGHHLQRVRRLRRGELVTVGDGAGSWRPYEVASVGPGRLVLHAVAAVVREPELVPAVAVAVALTKGGLDGVAARLTELGVARIVPVRAERSIARWDDARAAAAVTRLRSVAREAAAQARRARIPDVADPASVEALRGLPGLVVADRDGAPASALAEPASGTWTVLVGPEGGLSPRERAALADAPRLSVGPHVLRAETAPVAAAAVLVGRARWSGGASP